MATNQQNVEEAKDHIEQLYEYILNGYPNGNLEARAEMAYEALGGDCDELRPSEKERNTDL